MPLLVRTLLLWSLVACASVARAQEGRPSEVERPEVVELEFTGVESVDEDALRGSIQTQESECRNALFRILLLCTVTTSPYFVDKHWLERSELARDMLRIRIYYWRAGYREATVDTAVTALDDDGEKVRLTLSIEEGPPTLISSIRVVRPPAVLPDEQLERLLLLRAGQPLNLANLDSSRLRIRDALWQQGYADAEIDTAVTVSAETRSGAIEIRVDPRWVATIGDIVISGNQRISERTILNSLIIEEGDIYRRSDVLRSQRNLYESALFQHAAVVVPPQGDTTKLIDITVREAPLQYVRVAGGLNTVDYAQLEARYANLNWFGRARRLEVRGSLGNLLAEQLTGKGPFEDVTGRIDGDPDRFLDPNWTASAELRQPWFLSPLNVASVSVFGHRRSAPGVFVDRGHGASGTFTREIARSITSSANYRFEVVRIGAGDVYLCINFGVCDTETVSVLQRPHRLSPASLSATADRSNDPLSPTRGWRATASLEHASAYTGSDFRYNRASADGALYLPLAGHVIAGRLRIGVVRAVESTSIAVGVVAAGDPLLHPRKRFYAGGSQSVRGYGENQLGPRVLTIDPAKLEAIGCDISSAAVAGCDIDMVQEAEDGTVSLDNDDFQPRPLGGNSILEGSVEFRFGIWEQLSGAVFLDGAIVGERSVFSITGNTAALTPGVGVRYTTPIGPVRVDLGVNPCLAESLPVVTQVEGADGASELVRLDQRRVYSRCTGSSLLSRLQLHLSIGQAY